MGTSEHLVRAIAPVLFVLAACSPPAEVPSPELAEPALALVGGRVVDGRGGPPIESGTVLIRGERIGAVGPVESIEVPADAEVLDVSGKTVLPGLIESNGHVVFDGQIDHAAFFARHVDDYETIGARNLAVALAQGVTTVRDTHGPESTLLRLRDRVASGELLGARLYTAGAILNYESLLDIPTERELDPEQVERARAELDRFLPEGSAVLDSFEAAREAGVDFIKISLSGFPPGERLPRKLSDEEVRTLVEAAHEAGLRVTSHTMNLTDLERAVELGFDAMEHPAFTLDRGRGVPIPQELVERIAEQKVVSVPLLVAMEVYLTFQGRPELIDDPVLSAPLDPALVDEVREWARAQDGGRAPASLRSDTYAVVRDNLRRLIAAGAPIAMGTDRGTRRNFHQHGNHVRELEIYVELGMTPLEAITSATLRGAELLGVEGLLGTLEPGKLADVLVVDGDPTREVRDLANVDSVFLGGARVPVTRPTPVPAPALSAEP